MNFYAIYAPGNAAGSTVTALQGTTPWIVAGQGTAGASATGVVTVQGIAGGTPIPVTTTPSVTPATFQDGSLAFGSISTSYQTVVTTGGIVKHVDLRNNTNQTMVVSLNGGTSTSYTLDAGDQVSLDLAPAGSSIPSGTALQVKALSTLPTIGSMRINVFY
jgi:hypothetical protein